ncbi:MAG: hypothetical protein HC868_17530 [Sphingomonadales bacterium]|nr:hypothetical protein [Sphingomonadales bacterium]
MPAASDPERAAAQRQIRHLIEQAIDDLPEIFREVARAWDQAIEEGADFPPCSGR